MTNSVIFAAGFPAFTTRMSHSIESNSRSLRRHRRPRVMPAAIRSAICSLYVFTVILCAWIPPAKAQVVGSIFSANTESDFSKSNQSKVFYHDGKWWAIALWSSGSDWYIWQFDTTSGIWNEMSHVHSSSSRRPDAVLDAANNRLYVFLSSSSESEIKRYSYSGGTWVLDSGFPVDLPDFTDDDTGDPIGLVRGKNGNLWIFRITNNTLEAKKSANDGSTWTSNITLKTGLHSATGTADGVVFTNSSSNSCVGVAYAETNVAGSRFGFLVHRDIDANNVWTDETNSLTFTAGERATNELCVTADGGNNVYVLTHNANATGSAPRNTLYKRRPGGIWQSFAVNTTVQWTHPAIAVDDANEVLYVLGISAANGQGKYKSCALGQEGSLDTAATMTLFRDGATPDEFVDLSVPARSNSGSAPELMVCVGNLADGLIWYNRIPFGTGGGSTPLAVGSVTVAPNIANANAAYTIPITLGSAGALTAATGTISIQFPDNTFVPNSIGASQVTINGSAATAVTANGATREVTITTPVNLAAGGNVSIILNAGAGLLNPSSSGSKTLSVWTSAEPSPVASPAYSIAPANTSVTAATVTPAPKLVNTAAAYTLAFNLGARGRLIAGSSTITITFNSATTVSNGSITGAQINGVNASATGNSVAKTVILTVPASLNLGNSAAINISLPATAVTNPASAGNYTLTVATSVEVNATTSNAYAISLNTSLTVGSVALSTNEANAGASYTIPLTLGSSGALGAGSGTITIQFPNNTFVPGSIATNQVTVGGVAASAVAANSSTREVTVTVPANLAGGANVNLVFNTPAGLLNPSNAGNYTLQARTSAEPTPVASPAYVITAALTSVSVANVTPTPNTINSAAAYSIAFSLGAHGRLIAGSSTITITFNSATTVSNGSITGAQINGVNANATGNSVAKTILLTVPASLNLGNSAAVNISLPAAAVTNPASAGNYTLTVATGVEVNATTSNAYAISLNASLMVGSVALSTNETNAGASYTIPLTLGSNGALGAGSGTITIQFPNNTFVPVSIATNQVTVGGVAASAVTANSSTREVTVTVPSNLAGGANVNLVFNTPAGLLNPSNAGNFTLQARSSAEPTPTPSPAYVINPALTIVTVADVTPTPNTIDTAAAYSIAFNLGAHGRLIAGSSTITITFNSATTVSNGSITGAQINGVNANATGNSVAKTILLTVPASLNLGNGAAVTADLPASAITNPSSGAYYTLAVATSVEATQVVSNAYLIQGGGGAPPPGNASPITVTGAEFDKPHQSRVFYHADKWWLTAVRKSDNTWRLWKFNGTNWIQQLQVAGNGASRPDCFVDNANNKLYIFVSHNSQSSFLRLSYSAGAWSMDAGYPANVPNFTHSGEYSVSFSRAKNGELWAFRASNSVVEGIVSFNEGQTWSGVITIKSGLNNEALTDCHAFSTGSGDFMGVCYSENSMGGSVVGFLRHQDGANQSSWTDETSLLPPYSGTQSDDHINMAVANDGTVYLITKTDGGGNTIVDNGLYKRSTGGTWQLFAVNRGGGWTRPALGIDQSNSQLYAFGTPEGTGKLGYFKRVALGSESQLEGATQFTVFQGGSNSFVNLSVAQHNHTITSGMMVTVEDDVDLQVWYNLLSLGGGGSSPAPLVVNSVVANPDTEALQAAYTIGLTLGSQGALTGGSGTITVTWPSGTTIPSSMSTTTVTVNGNNAAAVTTSPANRRAIVTVPGNLANSASVMLAFSAGAGVVNPGAGDYTLQVQTSAQPADVNSQNYSIKTAAPPANPYGTSVAAATDTKLERSNQSKLLYFQNKWWMIAFDSVRTDWHLWRFSNGAWVRGLLVDGRPAVRIDAVLDSANSRLYYVSSHNTATKVGRLFHNGSSWIQEMALVSVAGFGHGTTGNAASLARAQNGALWLFRINGTALEAKVSSDNGQTWSATLVLKSGITGNGGNTDGLTFTANGNRVGVFYGMTSSNGGLEYGFLHHLDGQANATWTDESASLTFFNNERGNNLIHAQAANDGRLFLITRNGKTGAAGAVQNTLYVRTSGGIWSKYKVNVGNSWKSPIVALDETSNRLYVAGVRNDAPGFAEYKSCIFGAESTLEAQTATPLLQHNNDEFGELTAPGHVVYDAYGLMIGGTNLAANDVWYTQVDLGLPKQGDTNLAAIKMAADDGLEVSAYPNPFNPATTIRFRMKDTDNVRLRVFSIRGELIRTLVDQEMSAGVHERRWNGKDRNGRLVASGVYFYRLEIGNRIHHGRLQMLK